MDFELTSLRGQNQGHDFEKYFQFTKKNFLEFKEKDAVIQKHWSTFVQGGSVTKDEFLQKSILDSWKRCKKYGVQPFENEPSTILPEEFDARLKLYKRLSDICEISSYCFFSSLRGAGFCVELYDKDMVLLKQYGESYIIEERNSIGIFPGTNRSERFAGTTSSALTAILKKPMAVTGPEHYCNALHTYADISVPLRHNEGELCGVLSIISYHDFRQISHVINLLMAVGKVIEFCYDWGKIKGEVTLLKKCLDDISANTSVDGIIAANDEGNVRFINKIAGEILDLDTERVINQSVKSYFDMQSSIVRAFEENTAFQEQELVFSNEGKRIVTYGSITPVQSNDEDCGMVATFKNNARIKDVIKNKKERAFFTFDDILGEEPNIRAVKTIARQAAKLPFDVILHGESGTGKELFAQALHFERHGDKEPFISVNCAAIPAELIESELFGYEEGAFTGAVKGGKSGIFERTKYGTLFLDEINSMSLNMQTKLLRVLQNRVFTKLGCGTELPFQGRIISATNADLQEEIKKGTFREDLYYRLNVIDIHLPPLRNRKQDIPLLIKNCLNRINNDFEMNIEIDPDAVETLKQYDWPGNIRELENKMEKAVVVALSFNKNMIDTETLNHLKFNKNSQELKTDSFMLPSNALSEMEKIMIKNVILECGGNKTKAAERLGITRKTLYRKLKTF